MVDYQLQKTLYGDASFKQEAGKEKSNFQTSKASSVTRESEQQESANKYAD
jgi:hypothetical protein